MYVHNLSAVGEQYLDFEPADDKPPYAEDGDTLHGNAASLPVDEGALLVELNSFVDSVDKQNLQTVVRELGTMFHETGEPHAAAARQRLDVHRRGVGAHGRDPGPARRRADRAADPGGPEREHPLLLPRPGPDHEVAQGQRRGPAHHALRDPGDRARGRPAAHRARADAAGAAGQRDQRRPGGDAAPRRARAAAGGLPARDLQRLHRAPRATATATSTCSWTRRSSRARRATCRTNQWRPPSDLSDGPIFPAQCTAGAPYVQRGTPYSPDGRYGTPGAAYRGGYDPTSGIIDGVVDANGNPVHLGDQGNLSVLGDDSWKWLLVGPVVAAP